MTIIGCPDPEFEIVARGGATARTPLAAGVEREV